MILGAHKSRQRSRRPISSSLRIIIITTVTGLVT
jgi:hypothetical protein